MATEDALWTAVDGNDVGAVAVLLKPAQVPRREAG